MRVRFVPTLLLAAAALGAAAAAAQMPDVPPGKWWKRPAIVRSLGLTAEQQDKLDAILAKNRRSFIDLKADVEKRQLDVEGLMARKDSDPKEVSAAIDAAEEARGRLRKAVSLMVLDMRNVLTDAQWKMVVERREQWREERRELFRRGRLGRGGPGVAPGPPETETPSPPK
ncbi:MAG: periplasmic heavy metal sensor [Acidithiobacillales bacterium]